MNTHYYSNLWLIRLYPFGMPIMGRVSNGESGGYRYGFGGHEKDDEVKGDGNHLSFGDFGYDTRLGKRWNIDPLIKKMPSWSPYATFACSPIFMADTDGEYPVITITKIKVGTTKQRVIGYYSGKTQYTTVPLYKAVVTDTEDKNFKMTFSLTRDAFAVRPGDDDGTNITMTNVAFEPKDGNINHYTAKVIPGGYPQGDNTKALKLTQYGSEVVHAEANNASVELDYRNQADVAAGVMIHVGGEYKHADGSTSVAASEGCFGVTDGSVPSNNYSNKVIGDIINQTDKSKTNKGKIEVIIQKRDKSERTLSKTQKK